MDPRPHPKVIITDQDAAIARAVGDVFPDASHHHCLWHILKKFPEKMNVSRSSYTELHKDLVDIIMSSESTSDFEQRWSDKLLLPKLNENGWLADIYEIRAKWVPCFVKHIFCAGMFSSQRVESTHAFLKKYVNKKCTVSQCVTRITRAIMRQRHKELIAGHRDRNEVPRISSCYLMERQMAKMYTKAIFCKFQKELEKCALYTCHMTSSSAETKIYDVKRYDLNSNSSSTTHTLTYDISMDFVGCSCQKFEFMGIVCRHILIWMRLEQVLLLPERYILHRWTKKEKINPVYQHATGSFVSKKLWARRV
ncbi:unnamed protein product [Cuscuta epithymum]|uniref:Protein FAR1-RELATED SEQUENCE n=1 Tax=Cuscuta epithymum TaxID=186058 RepID=A0AAV0DHF0_9ASTE|nr:unnamed protein product [Cuscuta epithymum]